MVTIKKYANRRLYDASRSCYITLGELAQIVKGGEEICVIDARTGQDLTRPTLVQVILEIELEGHQMLPVDVLRQIIMAYGSQIEPLLSRYLERTMSSFARHHALANHALETSLDAISREQAGLGPSQSPVHSPADNDMISQLRDEVELLKDRLKTIDRG